MILSIWVQFVKASFSDKLNFSIPRIWSFSRTCPQCLVGIGWPLFSGISRRLIPTTPSFVHTLYMIFGIEGWKKGLVEERVVGWKKLPSLLSPRVMGDHNHPIVKNAHSQINKRRHWCLCPRGWVDGWVRSVLRDRHLRLKWGSFITTSQFNNLSRSIADSYVATSP